jgi:hypothetical protein
MTAPDDNFSKLTIVIIGLALIAATALTIEGTYLALKTFVFDRNDPLAKAGGLSMQTGLGYYFNPRSRARIDFNKIAKGVEFFGGRLVIDWLDE